MKRVLALLVLAVAVAGCTTSGNDAGIENRAHGDRPVYDMPDGYPNVSAVCVKSHLVIVLSSDVAPWVNPDTSDPSCAGLDGVPPRKAAS